MGRTIGAWPKATENRTRQISRTSRAKERSPRRRTNASTRYCGSPRTASKPSNRARRWLNDSRTPPNPVSCSALYGRCHPRSVSCSITACISTMSPETPHPASQVAGMTLNGSSRSAHRRSPDINGCCMRTASRARAAGCSSCCRAWTPPARAASCATCSGRATRWASTITVSASRPTRRRGTASCGGWNASCQRTGGSRCSTARITRTSSCRMCTARIPRPNGAAGTIWSMSSSVRWRPTAARFSRSSSS